MLQRSLKFSRRRFNQLITLTTVSILANEIVCPEIARAGNAAALSPNTDRERYHIVIGDKLAQVGGQQSLTLKSGIIKTISIPKYSQEGTQITLKNAASDGSDAIVILHTLYDRQIDIDGLVEQGIVSVPVLKATRDRCRDVYQQLKLGNPVRDSQTLQVLDLIVAGSSKLKQAKSGEMVQKRYELASRNARLTVLQTYIEESINQSQLPAKQKQKLKGIYQYVRANEPLPNIEDLEALTDIDAIVQGSTLSIPLRQIYALASAQSRAFTVDEALQKLIRSNYPEEDEAAAYLEIYNQIRLGLKVENQEILTGLNLLIEQSNLRPEIKAIYRLARDRFFDQSIQEVENSLQQDLQMGQQAIKITANIVPTITQIFAAGGVTAGTGTAISSLTGAAATNATLATLGGGSVAAGGLGMLGGLAVATGGAALVGAATLVSISIVADMPASELQKLGVAATAGTLASATIMGTAWAVANTFLIAGELTGAAAISAAIAALGGVTAMTGGATLIAFGIGSGVWHFLKNEDAALAKALREIEPNLYIISIADQADFPMAPLIKEYLRPFQKNTDRVYVLPHLPAEKISTVFANYAFLDREEKILAIIDTSILKSGKTGITFTSRGIWWKDLLSQNFVEYSDPDYLFKIKKLPGSNSDIEEKRVYELALRLGNNFNTSRAGIPIE